MPTTSPDNLRFPLRADKPAGADQIEALAVDVQAALTAIRAADARQWVESTRTADAAVAANTPLPLVPQLTINDARPGIYLTAVLGAYKPAATTGTPVDLVCARDGTVLRTVRKERAGTTYLEWVSASLLLPHAGGTLRVDWSVIGLLTGVTVVAGAAAQLVRVSA